MLLFPWTTNLWRLQMEVGTETKFRAGAHCHHDFICMSVLQNVYPVVWDQLSPWLYLYECVTKYLSSCLGPIVTMTLQCLSSFLKYWHEIGLEPENTHEKIFNSFMQNVPQCALSTWDIYFSVNQGKKLWFCHIYN